MTPPPIPANICQNEKKNLCATAAQTRVLATVNSSAMKYIALQRNEM